MSKSANAICAFAIESSIEINLGKGGVGKLLLVAGVKTRVSSQGSRQDEVN